MRVDTSDRGSMNGMKKYDGEEGIPEMTRKYHKQILHPATQIDRQGHEPLNSYGTG